MREREGSFGAEEGVPASILNPGWIRMKTKVSQKSIMTDQKRKEIAITKDQQLERERVIVVIRNEDGRPLLIKAITEGPYGLQ